MTEVLQALKTLDEQALVQLVANLAGSGAPYVLGLVARFSGIPEKELREDPAIGLDGLVEILQAIFEVNGWGNVLAAVREALPQKPRAGRPRLAPGRDRRGAALRDLQAGVCSRSITRTS